LLLVAFLLVNAPNCHLSYVLASVVQGAHTLCDLAGVEMFLNLRARALKMLQASRYLNPVLNDSDIRFICLEPQIFE